MIRKSLAAFAFAMCISAFGQNQDAQDTSYWITGGQMSWTFNQVSLTNWAAGGQNSTSIVGLFSKYADYREERKKWLNSLDLGYGFIKQGDTPLLKSEDRIQFNTNYGYKIVEGNEKWFFTVNLDFKTQFAEGFSRDDPDSVISRFMAPAYLVIGTGIDYSPNKVLSFSYIPLTGKMTFVTDDMIVGTGGAYGVEGGKNARAELGSFFRATYKQEAFPNVHIDSRLELFTNYQKESFGNIDVNWQNSIVMKINKHMSTNIFTQLLYDDDIKIAIDEDMDGTPESTGPRLQTKNILGVGVTYLFGVQKEK